MVAVCNKEFLGWYLITLKLKERLEAGLPNTSPRSDTTEPPPLQVVVDGGIRKSGIGSPNPPEDDWVISINKKLKDARQYDAALYRRKICIYRVPQYLRNPQYDKAYIPKVVSLGPYHHGGELLQPMELHKWRALDNILERNDQSIKLYLDSMKELEDKARACYEGPLKPMSSNEFAEMMVLDGCFVLEFLQATTKGFGELGYNRDDPVFSVRGTIQYFIQRDMIVLENQIPLFVLDKLYGLQLKKRDLKGQVAQLAIAFFSPLIRDSTPFDPLSLFFCRQALHCLDVFRSCLYEGPEHVPRKRPRDNHHVDARCQQLIHCATDLKDAGIKFKQHETDRFRDIQFNNGVLHIPPILIDNDTEPLLRNLIAFEQCHTGCKKDITRYVLFLNNLIDSAEDVSYLRYHKIIEHCLGDDGEVAKIVNRLSQEMPFDIYDSDFSEVTEKINEHYDRKWNTWQAILKQRYFSNPWATLSLVAAVTLLLLTAAQTFYTVYGYHRPRK